LPLPSSSPIPRQRDADLATDTPRVAHLDIDAFLASVEQALHPELRGRPVVVGGPPTSRNLVMSCSYDARARGVHPGMLLAEAHRRCPRAHFRNGDSQAANRLREAVTRVLLGYSPRVEVASIDDFFVDLRGTARLHGAACQAAESMRDAIRAATHLPSSAGVGTSKLMARLAGKLAEPGGVAEILPGHERAFLAGLPVELLPGVGRAISARLEGYAIRTVGELALVSRELCFASFGREGLVLHERARGIDRDPVDATHTLDEGGRLIARPPRSIHRESTFEPEEGRRELVEAMLAYLTERAAQRLRAHGQQAGSIEVHLRYVDARARTTRGEASEKNAFRRRRALPDPTDSTDALVRHARSILRALPHKRSPVKRVGLVLHSLRTGGAWQATLFEDPSSDRAEHLALRHDGASGSRADRHRRLDEALDRLRGRLGFGRILRGSSMPLSETHPLHPAGYRLRTPSLNQ